MAINLETIADDMRALPEDDWRVVMNLAQAEFERRHVLSTYDETASDLLQRYQAAKGGIKGQGAAYRPPAHGGEAYWMGAVVEFEGSYYRATRAGVVHSPTESPTDWQELTAEEVEALDLDTPADLDVTEWAPGLALKVGDLVSYQGRGYKVIQAHTTQVTWEPPAVAALFTPITS